MALYFAKPRDSVKHTVRMLSLCVVAITIIVGFTADCAKASNVDTNSQPYQPYDVNILDEDTAQAGYTTEISTDTAAATENILYALDQVKLAVSYSDAAYAVKGNDKDAALAKAIEAFLNSLTVFTKTDYPVEYARVCLEIGFIYERLVVNNDSNASENTTLAISYYTEAMEIFGEHKMSLEYCAAEAGLGWSYKFLASSTDKSREANLRDAIKYCTDALKQITINNYPFSYALIQNDLGDAYAILSFTEEIKSSNQERINSASDAILCYKEALRIYIANGYEGAYAITVSNLGLVYGGLSDLTNKQENLKLGIVSSEAGIGAYKKLEKSDFSDQGLAINYRNLAFAYFDLAESENQEQNLNSSLKNAGSALIYFTSKTDPVDYARLQHTIGAASYKLAYINKAKHAKAIRYLNTSSIVFERAANSYRIANLYDESAYCAGNAGLASAILASYQDKKNNLQKAARLLKVGVDYYKGKTGGDANKAYKMFTAGYSAVRQELKKQ